MKIKLAFLWIYENFFNGLAKAKVSETEASSCVPAARLVPSMSDADAAADVQDTLTICFSQNLKFPSLLHLSVLQHVLIIPVTSLRRGTGRFTVSVANTGSSVQKLHPQPLR